MSRHRTAQRVVEEQGYGDAAGEPLLDPAARLRVREIGRVRVPEPHDVRYLLDLIGRLDRDQVERDRASYERGRVDERLYWRARQTLAGEQFGGATPLSARLRPLPANPLVWAVPLLALVLIVVGLVFVA